MFGGGNEDAHLDAAKGVAFYPCRSNYQLGTGADHQADFLLIS